MLVSYFSSQQVASMCATCFQVGHGSPDYWDIHRRVCKEPTGDCMQFAEFFLLCRWRLCVPPPLKWDLDPRTTGSFTDVRCQADGGYCVQVTGMHWEMVNSRFLCSGGTAMFVSSGHVTLDRCWVGGVKDDMMSNNGEAPCACLVLICT